MALDKLKIKITDNTKRQVIEVKHMKVRTKTSKAFEKIIMTNKKVIQHVHRKGRHEKGHNIKITDNSKRKAIEVKDKNTKKIYDGLTFESLSFHKWFQDHLDLGFLPPLAMTPQVSSQRAEHLLLFGVH